MGWQGLMERVCKNQDMSPNNAVENVFKNQDISPPKRRELPKLETIGALSLNQPVPIFKDPATV